jgi:hypothetical protein
MTKESPMVPKQKNQKKEKSKGACKTKGKDGLDAWWM